ncbi:hypothetical protein QBC45DRAFT_432030 [Copromyces sp. CBS 386.78]|nr:hypothetical protein QBC45DRAFT_432030 [Copromyces sp. CBS 386.78]
MTAYCSVAAAVVIVQQLRRSQRTLLARCQCRRSAVNAVAGTSSPDVGSVMEGSDEADSACTSRMPSSRLCTGSFHESAIEDHRLENEGIEKERLIELDGSSQRELTDHHLKTACIHTHSPPLPRRWMSHPAVLANIRTSPVISTSPTVLVRPMPIALYLALEHAMEHEAHRNDDMSGVLMKEDDFMWAEWKMEEADQGIFWVSGDFCVDDLGIGNAHGMTQNPNRR